MAVLGVFIQLFTFPSTILVDLPPIPPFTALLPWAMLPLDDTSLCVDLQSEETGRGIRGLQGDDFKLNLKKGRTCRAGWGGIRKNSLPSDLCYGSALPMSHCPTHITLLLPALGIEGGQLEFSKFSKSHCPATLAAGPFLTRGAHNPNQSQLNSKSFLL